jgi:hypothetical protein
MEDLLTFARVETMGEKKKLINEKKKSTRPQKLILCKNLDIARVVTLQCQNTIKITWTESARLELLNV